MYTLLAPIIRLLGIHFNERLSLLASQSKVINVFEHGTLTCPPVSHMAEMINETAHISPAVVHVRFLYI